MRWRTNRPVADDETLIPHADDTPDVAQMKLLRIDLREDRRARRIFERNVKVAVALIGLFTFGSTLAWWGTHQSDRAGDRRDCESRAEGRENSKQGTVEGLVTVLEETFGVFGAGDDPRLAVAIKNTRTEAGRRLDELLPPITC